MSDSLQSIDIKKIFSVFPDTRQYAMGEDFIIAKIDGSKLHENDNTLKALKYPMRFDGLVFLFLQKGTAPIKIDVNINTYMLELRTFVLVPPESIMRLYPSYEDAIFESELIFVFFSREFLSNIQIDFQKGFREAAYFLKSPCIRLTEEQIGMATEYYSLGRKIVQSNIRNKRQAIGALLVSLIFTTVTIWEEHIQTDRERDGSSRVQRTYELFITMVSEHYLTQRGMRFYAENLCITPKYLSKIIKQASGRSGPEWIDAFVILEAKNLLRYSDMSIKEIVARLNFANPSVFNKYFKKHTGMTPSQYRKG